MLKYAPKGKDARVQKLWNRGMRDPKQIARKLGFQDLQAGEERVREGLERLGVKP